MAGKPDLSTPQNVQNVVVYVSNDNFAQAYTVNAPQPAAIGYGSSLQQQQQQPKSSYPPPPPPDKPQQQQQVGYFNGFAPQPYQNNEALVVKNYGEGGQGRPPEKAREECDAYVEGGYVTAVVGAPRCDSVRSETAESSCSSLSSADEGGQGGGPPADIVVYDGGGGVSVRPAGVTVLVEGQQEQAQQAQAAHVPVPHGWKRILNNGAVVYISPSNAALSSPEQVKSYLLTTGTCKCGLECHFKYENIFNFDPKVGSKPWVMTPDTNTGDLTKLCNHKRKIIAMASLDCKPPDPNIKLRKEYNIKRKKRKISLPYSGGVSVSQILAHREKLALNQPNYSKDVAGSPQQIWQQPIVPSRLQNYPPEQNHHLGQPMLVGEGGAIMVQQQPQQAVSISQNHAQQMHPQQIIGPNGQILSVQNHNGMLLQGQPQQQQQQPQPQQRLFVSDPNAPGRPIQIVSEQQVVGHQRPPEVYAGQPHYQMTQQFNGFRLNHPHSQIVTSQHQQQQQQQKILWQNRMHQQKIQTNHVQGGNVHERVPPLHQHAPMWQEEIKRKKAKLGKMAKSRQGWIEQGCPMATPCPNIDVRQIQADNRAVIVGQMQHGQSSSSPSFMEDPSGYLAQQTALLNNTINRQTGANGCSGYICSSPQSITPSLNEVPLPSNVKSQNVQGRTSHSLKQIVLPPQQQQHQQQQQQQPQYSQVQVQPGVAADSSVVVEQHQYSPHCQGCIEQYGQKPDTPNSEDPVTSSTYLEKQASPDSRPIQGGTVSTSNVSPMDGTQSDPPTPNSHTPTPPQRLQEAPPQQVPFVVYSQQMQPQPQQQQQQQQIYHNQTVCCSHAHPCGGRTQGVGAPTMASGRTVGSNTITSVLAGAGRTSTATVSISSSSTLAVSGQNLQTQAVAKSPLEMVQSVVSSIQVPQQQQQAQHHQQQQNLQNQQISSQIVKHSPTGLPPGHILVSSGGQLIMANTTGGQGNLMAPPPPKIISSQGGMPPISVSPMVTNVTASVTQVIPAVAQQVLGQQTVLVNALPAPFVLQPGVTMTMDGMTVGQNVQIPQLMAGNVIQQQIQIDNGESRRVPQLLSPETKKKGKKRKVSQTVASMLHIAAAQQNSGMVMSQQGFPQQIQMAHSPQGLTAAPVMQALTLVPSKTGGAPQIQQLITNSQPAQQINLLQPVNLINGTTGVVQNFPIQQFIVPNLGGMVMNPDGTATLLQDTSNLGMQLQIQNVNGQNVLTPSGVFNGGQSILAAGPAGMVIRAPQAAQPQNKMQHSPGAAQFATAGGQFIGQLSPLVATNVSPTTQQVTFGHHHQQQQPQHQHHQQQQQQHQHQQQVRAANGQQGGQQEYIQMNGQTLMVPCAPTVTTANQNTTFVQQNTTIVQQQTTMVANNQQLQNFQQNNQQSAQQGLPRAALNLDQQNYIINDNKQMQTIVVQRESPHNSVNYRQSVSTQTAVNQNAQSVTTNTFCQTSTISAGSPPDTTTMSPGGQSPPTADTTTHTGSTDDGLSPAPSSNCSEIAQTRPGSCAMAMVHCISSSEPDSADLATQLPDHDWRSRGGGGGGHQKAEYGEIPTKFLHYVAEHMKQQEAVVSSRNYDKIQTQHKRKGTDTLVVVEGSHVHTSLFGDNEEVVN